MKEMFKKLVAIVKGLFVKKENDPVLAARLVVDTNGKKKAAIDEDTKSKLCKIADDEQEKVDGYNKSAQVAADLYNALLTKRSESATAKHRVTQLYKEITGENMN